MSVFCTDKATCLLRWIVTNTFLSVLALRSKTTIDLRDGFSETEILRLQRSCWLKFFSVWSVCLSCFSLWLRLYSGLHFCWTSPPAARRMTKPSSVSRTMWRKMSSFGRLFWVSDDPIDCNSAEFQNGSADVICYQIVFNIWTACGAGYGGFKLAVIVLNAATTMMMLHQGSRSVKRTRIITGLLLGWLLIAIFVACVISGVAESKRGSAIVKHDSQGVVLQLLMLFSLGIISVFFCTLEGNSYLSK